MLDISSNVIQMVVGQQSVSTVLLTNKSTHSIAFKVRSRHSKHYSVTPHIGKLNSKCNLTIQIRSLQNFSLEQSKDEFLILYECIEEGIELADFWKDNTTANNIVLKIEPIIPQLLEQVRHIEELSANIANLKMQYRTMESIGPKLNLDYGQFNIGHMMIAIVIALIIGAILR